MCRVTPHSISPSLSRGDGVAAARARRLAVEARDGAARSQLRSERPSRQSRPRLLRVFGQSPFDVRAARCVIARVRTGYCGVLRGDHGRARRSARAPLRVAVRHGAAGRGAGHVRAAAQRARAAARHAGLPGPARRQAALGAVLRRAAAAGRGHGALPAARHGGRRLRLAAAQEVTAQQRQEDQRPRQDQDGVHRQQAAPVHHLLQAEDRHHEEGGCGDTLGNIPLPGPRRQSRLHSHLWESAFCHIAVRSGRYKNSDIRMRLNLQ